MSALDRAAGLGSARFALEVSEDRPWIDAQIARRTRPVAAIPL
jgi:hypothetical protein